MLKKEWKKVSALAMIYCMAFLCSILPADGEQVSEYAVKAAYIYRFMLFTRLPGTGNPYDADKIVIGIYGPDPFGDILNELEGKMVRGYRVMIHYLDEEDVSDAEIRKCHVLFICRESGLSVLERLDGLPILTISDIPGFVDSGGMIELITSDNHIRFAINRRAANRNGISFSAQLLKIAIKVIE